jgi:Tol biopolymer transport system component
MSYRPVHRSFLVRSILAAGVVAASACVDAPPSAPQFVASEGASAAKQSTTSSRILVDRQDVLGTTAQVFSMNDDGTQVLQVTDLVSAFQPSWAPDRKRILFVGQITVTSPFDIGIMNSDGTGISFLPPLTPCENYPVALGKDLMFVDLCDAGLYRVRVDGTGLTKLADHALCDISQPSPDAQDRTVAFCGVGTGIKLLDVVSGAVTTLTNANEFAPAFSPNGKLIAFNRCSTTCDVWVMRADGSGATRLTTNGFWPHWSPDGKRIAFSSDRDDPVTGIWDVFTMNADGTGVTNLTRSTAFRERATAWTPY